MILRPVEVSAMAALTRRVSTSMRMRRCARSVMAQFQNLCRHIEAGVEDFQFPAVEHLGKVADFKKKWIQKHRRMLLKGQTDQVIAAIKALCRGRNSKDIAAERNYFIRNQHRMNYQQIADLKLPLGSGAMESAIRRVVNLRLKGASIYWLEPTAEAMLMLRSYYKSGRWNLLKSLSFSLY